MTCPNCCQDGVYCDACWERERAEHAYLRNVPRFQVYGDAQAVEEFNQQLRDAGRGHLVRES